MNRNKKQLHNAIRSTQYGLFTLTHPISIQQHTLEDAIRTTSHDLYTLKHKENRNNER